MEALIAAIFILTIVRPGQPPLQLDAPMPLAECWEEVKLATLRNDYEIAAGGQVYATCVITVAPSIHH